MAASAALYHRLICFFHVDARNFSQNRICQNRNGMVADHAVVVLSPEIPNRQIAVSFMMQNHIINKLCSVFRVD